jgi:hypothetical protein
VVAVEPTGLVDPAAIGRVPTLMVMGDYLDRSAHWQGVSARCMSFIAALRQQGGLADLLDLPAQDIRGNSHMPMMDDNNEQVLSLVVNWLRRMVP